jgi:hypothetical protein
MFHHHLSDGILPQVNALYATASYHLWSSLYETPNPKALLFCSAILKPDPDPEMRCLLSYCLLDYVRYCRRKLLEGWKVLKRGGV